MSNIQAIAVAVDSDKRLERRDVLSALEGAEISRVPDPVHWLQKLPHIISEDSVSVGNQPYEHFTYSLITIFFL